MTGFCLPKEFANKFIDALKSGKIKPEELITMTSAERRSFLEPIVGADSVREVNALLESKLLLKDQKRGLVSWAKSVSGITEPVRRDLLSKIERMDKVLDAENSGVFLEDLAAKRLGADVTFEEAKRIVDGTKALEEAKGKIAESDPLRSDARIEYGLKFTEFQKYIGDLKLKADTPTWKEWISSPSDVFFSIAGTTKSVLSSLDNSYFGRQGIKMLYTHPGIWSKNFIKSWGDIARELVRTKSSIDPMDIIKADVFSRPNALNGKYQAGGYDIGILSEEAFPTSIQDKIPLLGRFFNAAETAFNGGALRMRADYADLIIEKADAFGIDTLNPAQAKGLGVLVNSMTGRGSIGKLGVIGKEINSAVFSIKFLKSNFDTLTANRLGYAIERGATRDFVRREAAMNLMKIVATTGGILTIANLLYPGSVDLDPRSSHFGKIRIGKHTVDITGGMGAIVTLAARITPTYHDGKLSFWTKTRKGSYIDLTAGKYGQQNALDVINSFWQGKLSPIAGVARDVWTGSTYQGTKPTVQDELTGLFTPIPIQNFQQLNEPDAGVALGLMILDGLGLSVNTSITK